MTFTKAATRELSDRIRERLVEAAGCFRGTAPPAGDTFLQRCCEHPEGPLRSQAAWRLAMAAEAMDDAAVHTIDAWCQRMLREHAFDSGCLFDETKPPAGRADYRHRRPSPDVLADARQAPARLADWRQQVYRAAAGRWAPGALAGRAGAGSMPCAPGPWMPTPRPCRATSA
jgi:hypothetical protein